MSDRGVWFLGVAAALAAMSCGGDDAGVSGEEQPIPEGVCEVDTAPDPDSLRKIGCTRDFQTLASAPLDASIPGARSAKVVLDLLDDNALYFQNSNKYSIHYEFASKFLSGNGKPPVTSLSEFNQTEYYSPDRRFILGAITYYEGPKVWALEIAPYDTSSPQMITLLFESVKAKVFFGSALVFHPTSENVQATAKQLPATIKVLTTDDLYKGIDYQPLNLGETVGQVRFLTTEQLDATYVTYRDIVVLDRVPNDISVVAALITAEFQTPLAHVNVLAQNRKTPNMGLKNAAMHPLLKPLEGKWVKLTVSAFDWKVQEVTQAEAEAYWEAHKPKPVVPPELDLSVTDLRDIADVTEQAAGKKVTRDAIKRAVQAFGAKAANYSVLVHTQGIPIKPGFAIPVYYYEKFMRENGFFDRLDQMLADPAFRSDPQLRDAKLEQLRDDIKDAPVGVELETKLRAKLDKDFPNRTMRFRSSTNAEDLDGFPCAGCYDSHTGDPADWQGDMLRAIKQTWATVFSYRTFEEREYHGIDHKKVAMALLVHTNFPAEEANGVAITANPYDPSGLSPGFYVNVQTGGEAEVVAPPPGVTSDSFIYQYEYNNMPVIYLTRSNLTPNGSNVLTARQINELGKSLSLIHAAFTDAYGPGVGTNAWYAMDVEFKYDDELNPGQPATLYIKQARPY
ncbi:MAG TPA: PEP/pyruvate-binding domain-containing protein, partial [Polyangiales bacterium]|nr:PEP/pyruvate-binding domain-containing protein [Polyangiales bacterium]